MPQLFNGKTLPTTCEECEETQQGKS